MGREFGRRLLRLLPGASLMAEKQLRRVELISCDAGRTRAVARADENSRHRHGMPVEVAAIVGERWHTAPVANGR